MHVKEPWVISRKSAVFVATTYNSYYNIWEAAIGVELNCTREPSNCVDRYTVAIVKGNTVVGRLPKKLACINFIHCSYGGVV